MLQSRKAFSRTLAEKTVHLKDDKELVQAVAAYLIENNEPYDLNSVMRDIVDFRAEKGLVEATIVSAHEVDDKVRGDALHLIKQIYPKAHSVTLNERLEPALMGGVRLEMPGQELDLSLRERLGKLKRFIAEEGV